MDPLTEPAGGNLTTARLVLRNWEDADAEGVFELSTDPEVMRHFPGPATREQIAGMVERHLYMGNHPIVEIGDVQRTIRTELDVHGAEPRIVAGDKVSFFDRCER